MWTFFKAIFMENTMKKFLILSAILLVNISFISAKKIEVFNAKTIVDLVQEKIATIKSFTGSFVYRLDTKKYSGNIVYKQPNKFSLTLNNGPHIFSDGLYLYIDYKGQNVAVKEYLGESDSNPLMGWNIKRLLREYTPSLPKGGYKVVYGSTKMPAYKILFVPKSNTSGFREIEMIVSEDGLIQKVTAQNQLGKELEMSISYRSFNVGVGEDTFKFEPDENTQTFENIWEIDVNQ